MQMRRIGSLEVSVVGLGCNNFGRRLDAEATAAVVNAALDAGVNLFDTADAYGGTLSETYLGKALGARRDKIVLATKFGMEIDATHQGAAPTYVRAALDDSLRRLGTDRIDLYQLHRPDPTVPIAETLGALEDLIAAGKIREIGCSNFSVAQLEEATPVIGSSSPRFASVQNELSLLDRDAEADVLPYCAAQNLAFLPYFPLAGGMLSGKYKPGASVEGRLSTGGRLSDKYRSPANTALVERLRGFAEERGHSLLELAFAWQLSHAPVSSVIAGATTPEQVRANVAAASWTLEPTDLEKLAAVLA
jgi:aryl-alcohol dehydrogenase-like predicted oxidoreductase